MTNLNDAQEFKPEDDAFNHGAGSEDWWFTETSWFSFHNVEYNIGGWLYTMLRPNIGTVAGGAWVWDDTAHLPWEVLYSQNFSALQIPEELNLPNLVLPTGVTIGVLDPGMVYSLGYDDPGKLTVDLNFAARQRPRPLGTAASTFGKAAHFDQIGNITGHIELSGKKIEIDCWSMRDRTWGRRPENRPRQAGYVTGAGQGGAGFLAVSNTRDGTDQIAYGFVQRGETQVSFERGQRDVIRDPENGWVDEIRIEAIDENGDSFTALGKSTNRITINRHTFIDVNSVIRWELQNEDSGKIWWGEDQDMWPMHRWSEANKNKDWSIS
jgi:hypothetical protein